MYIKDRPGLSLLRVNKSASATRPCRANPSTCRQPPFAGKTRALAESHVSRRQASATLAVGKAIRPKLSRENTMTPLENKSHSLNNSFGTGLLLFGATLSYLRIENITQHIANTVAAYGSEALGLFPAMGLAAARIFQELTLNPASALSAFLQFLLSFWPVAIIFLGALLLRKSIFPIVSLPVFAEQESDSRPQPVRE
jgi:hypothetical protein